ncbi:MAG: hypothetical protein JWL73_1614, partial [Actinomycetia bacterium]|nr:hypothetical protein [Actinomycetes bacterium]
PQSRKRQSFVRAERHLPGDSCSPTAAAADLVRSWIRSEPHVELARIHTHRRKIRVYDRSGASVGEVDDDEVTATVPLPVRFHEVEVEMDETAHPHLVDALVHRLRAAGAGTGDSSSKVARVLGDRAKEPPDLPSPRPLGPDSTVADVVQASVASGVERLLANDPIIRTSDDPEGIHQARVATRRLRSDLRTFRPVIDARWSEPLRAELKWLGEEIGRVRDADVLLGLLQTKAADVPSDARAAAQVLVGRLSKMRDRDRDALLQAMASERYAKLLDRLVEGAAAPVMRHPDDATPARKAVGKLAGRPWKQLRKRVRRLGEEPSDTDLHEVRKRAKQARYALEAIAPVAGRRAAEHGARIAELQDVLGDLHDAVVAAGWLHDAARDTDDPDVAFTAGLMAASFGADRLRLRAEWKPRWKRVVRRNRYRYA